MHFCAENGQAVKWQPINYCCECNYQENNRHFASSLDIFLYVSSSWSSCSSCWEGRWTHSADRSTWSTQRSFVEQRQEGVLPAAGGAMRWHWAGTCQAGLGAPGPALGSSWSGKALAPPSTGTLGISRISHQAQPSGKTLCLVILSKLLL